VELAVPIGRLHGRHALVPNMSCFDGLRDTAVLETLGTEFSAQKNPAVARRGLANSLRGSRSGGIVRLTRADL